MKKFNLKQSYQYAIIITGYYAYDTFISQEPVSMEHMIFVGIVLGFFNVIAAIERK